MLERFAFWHDMAGFQSFVFQWEQGDFVIVESVVGERDEAGGFFQLELGRQCQAGLGVLPRFYPRLARVFWCDCLVFGEEPH